MSLSRRIRRAQRERNHQMAESGVAHLATCQKPGDPLVLICGCQDFATVTVLVTPETPAECWRCHAPLCPGCKADLKGKMS